MRPESRRLLQSWLKQEEPSSRSLAELLPELEKDSADVAPLARFLAIKEREERARMALLLRAQWYRSFSWKMVGALFVFGGAALVVFWAGWKELAFPAAIFFFAGAAAYYLLIQAMATRRSQRDEKALREIQERCRRELAALRDTL